MNKVLLSGTVVNVDLWYSAKGLAIGKINMLALQPSGRYDEVGNLDEQQEIPVLAFGELATEANSNLEAGDVIEVVGHTRVRSTTSQSGKTFQNVEICAERISRVSS
jgi:single-stranded DNA-binding protein